MALNRMPADYDFHILKLLFKTVVNVRYRLKTFLLAKLQKIKHEGHKGKHKG